MLDEDVYCLEQSTSIRANVFCGDSVEYGAVWYVVVNCTNHTYIAVFLIVNVFVKSYW